MFPQVLGGTTSKDTSNTGKLWSASENPAVFFLSTVQWGKEAIFPTVAAAAERPLLMIYCDANFTKHCLG